MRVQETGTPESSWSYAIALLMPAKAISRKRWRSRKELWLALQQFHFRSTAQDCARAMPDPLRIRVNVSVVIEFLVPHLVMAFAFFEEHSVEFLRAKNRVAN